MKEIALTGIRILVVEDNPMVAASLVEALTYADAQVVGVIDNLTDAIAFAADRHREIDIAMLDVDLSGVMSYPIADLLARNGVPFIFTTGYDVASMHADYRAFPIYMKPFSFSSILSAIHRVLGSGVGADPGRD